MSSTFDQRNINHGIVGPLVCCVIAIIAVAGRLTSRVFAGVSFGWDDWFAILAIIFFIALTALEVWAIEKAGWALDPVTIPKDQLPLFFKAAYAGPLLTVTALAFAKYSILCFYYRLFAVKRDFKIALWALSAFCVGIHLVEVFVVLFQCTPVRAGWDVTLKENASCINLVLFTVIIESFNCLSEVLMGILPMRSVQQLNMPFRQRFALIFVFALGFFTAVVSIVRIVQTWWPSATSADLTSSTIWSDIQVMVAILAGSLPMYRKLLPERLDAIPSYVRSAFDRLVSSRGSDGSRSQVTPAGSAAPSQDFALSRMTRPSKSTLHKSSAAELKTSAASHRTESSGTEIEANDHFGP